MKFPLIFFVLLCIYSCSVKRFIPQDETLYKGAMFKISVEEKTKDLKLIKQELQAVLRPQPNTTKLGLIAHYKQKKDSTSLWYKFLNKKIGETPVYQSSVAVDKTEKLIVNRLENLGFFNSNVTSKIKVEDKKSKVIYTVKLKKPYKMETYQIDEDTLFISKEIKKILKNSLIKKGDRFNLSDLKAERERIDSRLKLKGYYNFNSDFLIFEIDTNQVKIKGFDLYVRLKKNTPKKAFIPYKLGDINVYPNFRIDKNKNRKDTISIKKVNFLQDSLFFKPKRLRPFIFFNKGQLYNPNKFKATSKSLSSIGTYKFVNVQFKEKNFQDSDTVGLLNTHIYLSPLNKRSLGLELQANTKSSGFTGPSLALNYTNRNLFKGGEFIKITGKLGYETQVGGDTNGMSGLTSTQLGLSSDLVFPRLLLPQKLSEYLKYTVAKTKINAGIEYLNRSNFYSLSSFNSSFGYQWDANEFVYHSLKPVNTSFVRLSNKTQAFKKILDNNPILKNSFEQELISGLTYSFTYSELGNRRKKHPFFFTSSIDIAGNMLSLFGKSKKTGNKQTVLGVEFAQYLKMDIDARFNLNLGKQQSLVTRLYGGLGYAYGNSDVLPFSKQFFSGGPYSIRAFRSRSIGPGTYMQKNLEGGSFFDNSGDIKLEMNVEYRFPIYSYIKGAFFADAGNVWLNNVTLPSGKFSSNFINELAIGAGLGLRLDVQSFVFRLDWAVPVHTPKINKKNKYTFDIEKGIFNLAIGYPF